MPSRKKPLNRQRILKSCIRYADKNGIDALNMRKVAGLCDAGVMSIYHHFANKNELLDAMVDTVAGEIVIPGADLPWRQAILQIATSANSTLIRHAWVNPLWSKRGPGENKLAHMESILRVLREAGFSVADACRGYHVISMHILGFTQQSLDFPITSENLQAAANNFLRDADVTAIPYFIEHVEHHLDHPEADDDFVFTLELILDGLARTAPIP